MIDTTNTGKGVHVMRMFMATLHLLTMAGTTEAQAPGHALTCGDFLHNPNGSWSPARSVNLNGVTIAPGMSFNPGDQFGAIDLAKILDAQCTSPTAFPAMPLKAPPRSRSE